jgi:hypothetical protein
MILNDEMERIWIEAVVSYFRALYQNFLGGTQENHDTRLPE